MITDEELEKEAEAWVEENMDCVKSVSHINPVTGCNYYSNEARYIAKQAVKDGIKIGYNKVKEGRPKWHDLRKNPNDLPNEYEIVLCYCSGYCGVSFPITAMLYIDYNDASIKRWWTLAGEGKSEQLNNVIAWKEIVLPKENE